MSLLSSEKLASFELCPRRYRWTNDHAALRVSPLKAVYAALDAGLKTDKEPERAAENQLISIASSPGLDILGGDVYSIAMHMAKLSGILAAALRSAWAAPWKPVDPVTLPDGSTWNSACYVTGDGELRRIVLVDRWSDDRKQQEVYGWRTVGETVSLDRPILITAVSIGSVHDKRRHSAWTRCYRHPRNRTFRLQRKSSDEDFSQTWQKVWREDSGISTAEWLTQMRKDGCMENLVHTSMVPVPDRRDDYMKEMTRLAMEMETVPELPPMRMAGCFGFYQCPFFCVCHGSKSPALPESYGFKLLR